MPYRHRRLALIVAAALAAGGLTTGCDTVTRTDITKEQAVTLVADRALEAFQQLPPGATLKKTLDQHDLACDQGSNGRTFVETDYAIEYPQSWPVEQTMATLSAYWQQHGYKIVRDDREDGDLSEIVVEHPDDGFRLTYLVAKRNNGRIDVVLSSSSPCR